MAALRVDVPGDRYHAGLISCQVACPVHTDARGYVRAIADGRFEEAYLIARGPNPFASICGRICGAPCEAACRRGKIPRVDDDGRFVGDRPADRHPRAEAIRLRAVRARGATGRRRPGRRRASYVPTLGADAEEMAALLRPTRGRAARAGRRASAVAIIGAGPAGLSAAHDLALLGFRPVVFETEPVPAGMLARRRARPTACRAS